MVEFGSMVLYELSSSNAKRKLLVCFENINNANSGFTLPLKHLTSFTFWNILILYRYICLRNAFMERYWAPNGLGTATMAILDARFPMEIC